MQNYIRIATASVLLILAPPSIAAARSVQPIAPPTNIGTSKLKITSSPLGYFGRTQGDIYVWGKDFLDNIECGGLSEFNCSLVLRNLFAGMMDGSYNPPSYDENSDCSNYEYCITVNAPGQPKAFINYLYPGFFTHVSSRHFGTDIRFGSVFRTQFQNENSLLALAVFAANNAPLRNTEFAGVYRYTANYSGMIGNLQGTGIPTSLITLIVRDTGIVNSSGQRVFQPITLYPGGDL